MWLLVLAHNLGSFMWRLTLPELVKHWPLTSIQARRIQTGGRLVPHARGLMVPLAAVLATRGMPTGMPERMSRLRLSPLEEVAPYSAEVERIRL